MRVEEGAVITLTFYTPAIKGKYVLCRLVVSSRTNESDERRESFSTITSQISFKMKFILALFISSAAAFSPSTFRPVATSTALNGEGEYGASSTSFYTTTEKQDDYDSLEDVLAAKCADVKVRAVITDMLSACADITEALRTALVTVEGSSNTFGDAQLSVDVSYSLT